MFNPVFKEKVQGQKHPGRCVVAEAKWFWWPGDTFLQVTKVQLLWHVQKCDLKSLLIYRASTVKPVYNDHLMRYFSAFWSSSRWPRATKMSSTRQTLLARVNCCLQSSLKHITELITGNKSYYRGGRYRQVSLYDIYLHKICTMTNSLINSYASRLIFSDGLLSQYAEDVVEESSEVDTSDGAWVFPYDNVTSQLR